MSPGTFRTFLRATFLSGLLAAVLAACATDDERGICPRVAILDQTSRLTQFAEGAAERPENVRFTAQITDIEIECRYEDPLLYSMNADVNFAVNIRRGPAMRGDAANFRYFVAVTDTRGNVLAKRVFDIAVDMDGQQEVRHVERTFQSYRFDRAGTGFLYEAWVGFQLTDQQLDYIRRQQAGRNGSGS